jgi:type I restriction enzyme R subunit
MHNRPKIPAETVREILIESGHRCAVCGAGTPLERAHVVPWIKSKSHKTENLINLCANCHIRADQEQWGENELKHYKRNPWVLRQYKDEVSRSEPRTKIKLEINIPAGELSDEKSRSLIEQAVAAFLNIPPHKVRVVDVEKP